jgi:hypothetical protein
MNQRTQFRFEAFHVNPVAVRLCVPDRPTLLGEPITIHSDGLRARFPADQDLGVALGSKVLIEFTCKGWRSPVGTVGRLHFRHDDDSLRELGFSFVKRRDVDEELFPRLRALFNRRGATRALPDPKEPIDVYLDEACTGRSIRGTLIEISSTGLSMQVDAEAGFVDARECRVSFHLPGPEVVSLSLAVHIRERRLCSNCVQLGLEFDAVRTATILSQRDKILEYVVKRQPRSSHRLKAG